MTSKNVSVLLVGGLEPSGQAGLLTDVATCLALKARPLAIASSLTAQGAKTPRVQAVGADVIRLQLDGLAHNHDVRLLKSGVVPNESVLKQLSKHVAEKRLLWVIDPIVQSSSGLRLSKLSARDFLALGALGPILTPNLDELSWLVGRRPRPRAIEEAVDEAKSLISLGFSAVVVKGGHALGQPSDLVCTPKETLFLRAGERLRRLPQHRGTGCRFASALAVQLAYSATLRDSVQAARRFVRQFLKSPP